MKDISLNKLIILLVISLLASCSTAPKTHNGIKNACDIYNRHKTWKKAFDNAYDEYGVPPQLIMSFIYQESSFRHNAKPKKKTFLGIRTRRISSAYGFPQALDKTWKWYKQTTGRSGADRDNLPDAVRFIGWYVSKNNQKSGVSKWNAREQYLAYHDGMGGYLKKTYLKKPWLVKTAKIVGKRAYKYRQDLSSCSNKSYVSKRVKKPIEKIQETPKAIPKIIPKITPKPKQKEVFISKENTVFDQEEVGTEVSDKLDNPNIKEASDILLEDY